MAERVIANRLIDYANDPLGHTGSGCTLTSKEDIELMELLTVLLKYP